MAWHIRPCGLQVSTHSRPKAAGFKWFCIFIRYDVSTHSRPKAAGTTLQHDLARYMVSTHSRPKAAGRLIVPMCASV